MSMLSQAAFSFLAGWQQLVVWVISLHPLVRRIYDLVSSCLVSLTRGGLGAMCAVNINKAPRPARPLKLFEFEACDHSRRVREVLSILDLEYEDYPCPPESLSEAPGPAQAGYEETVGRSRFKPALFELALRRSAQTPFLVDENRDVRLHDSDAMIDYLWTTYGAGAARPAMWFITRWSKTVACGVLSRIFRPLPEHGRLRLESSRPPARLLIFYQYEASPFCRLIREILTCLEIPFLVKPVAYGSARIPELTALSGSSVAPFLIDPNTDFRSRNTMQIMHYVWSTYGQQAAHSRAAMAHEEKQVPHHPQAAAQDQPSRGAALGEEFVGGELRQRKAQPMATGIAPLDKTGAGSLDPAGLIRTGPQRPPSDNPRWLQSA